MPKILQSILVALLPGIVLVATGWIAGILTGRARVRQLLARGAPADRKALNMRFGGYDTAAVQRYWCALDADALAREERFLRWDLLIPVFYTAAFAYSLAWMADRLGYSFRPVYYLPVVALLLADWVENMTQMGQLRRYAAGGASSLEPGKISRASISTSIKLALFAGLSLLLVALLLIALVRAIRA